MEVSYILETHPVQILERVSINEFTGNNENQREFEAYPGLPWGWIYSSFEEVQLWGLGTFFPPAAGSCVEPIRNIITEIKYNYHFCIQPSHFCPPPCNFGFVEFFYQCEFLFRTKGAICRKGFTKQWREHGPSWGKSWLDYIISLFCANLIQYQASSKNKKKKKIPSYLWPWLFGRYVHNSDISKALSSEPREFRQLCQRQTLP